MAGAAQGEREGRGAVRGAGEPCGEAVQAAGVAGAEEGQGDVAPARLGGPAAQVKQGAPADALVTADTKTMDGLSGETGDPTVIAKNRLVIAVEEGNPKKVESLKDLTDEQLKVVLAAEEVPVGRYGRQILDAQKLTVKPVSQEVSVRAVLSKVELGEADAGLVYKTDAETVPDKVDAVDIPDAQNAVASYPAATLKGTEHAKEADAFVKWLSSDKAQELLRKAGFQQP
ncbi:molybdate ABC transporter substrate-binding protein [Streptomyces albidoflavus]